MYKKLKFSLNIDFSNKQPKLHLSEYQNKFINVDGTLLELAEAINDGEAFSYQFHNEERKTANFLCSDFLVVDIDEGWMISDVLNHPLVSKHCSLLYTTPRHTSENHRFRLVFVLPKTIFDSRELKAATKSLVRRLGGDMSATDAARMFYGSINSYQEISNKELSEELLAELIADGLVNPVSDSSMHRPALSMSNLTIKPDFEITTAVSGVLKFMDFKKKTNVYCPFHPDKNASAFVGLNAKSIPYLVCSTCQFTRWLEGNHKEDFDFHSFENTVSEYLRTPPTKINEFETPLTRLLYDSVPLENKGIHFSNDRYLQINKIENGITFIKSPKGTGKTNFLKDYLKKIIFKNSSVNLESFVEDINTGKDAPIYTNKKVLLIGHRQALISEMCKRLGLVCYLDIKNTKDLAKGDNPNYGVCLDSLCVALGDQSKTKWDLIIIDESEQVLSHFLSETLGDKRIEIFNQLNILIGNAKRVVALDADLGWITFNTITRMAKSQSDAVIPIQIHINKWVDGSKPIFIYQTSSQLIDHLKQSIIDGKQIFVSSNSKNKIQSLEKAIEELANKLGIQIPMISITSENSKSTINQHFITNIKSEIIKYKVILSSPSLGTGIDITFDKNSEFIDCVYGLYENRINTHLEIDQQLRRVRHPKEVHVWVSPSLYNFESEFEVVKDEYLNNNFLLNLYYQQILTNNPLKISNEFVGNFLMMAALITVYQRSSKNKLKRNFLEYKQADGWQILDVLQDEIAMNVGKEFFKRGANLLSEEMIADILASAPLRREEYDDISERMDANDKEVSRSEYFSLQRTKLELFYRQSISRQLIKDDNKTKLRRGILAYEKITNSERIKFIIQDKTANKMNVHELGLHEKILPDKNTAAMLLYQLFGKTPIFSNGIFLESIEFKKDDLQDFIKLVIKRKSFIENHLGLNVRSDIVMKPVQFLGQLLKEVGLGHWKAKSHIVKGMKIYIYILDRDKLNSVKKTVLLREKIESQWSFFYDLHHFKDEAITHYID